MAGPKSETFTSEAKINWRADCPCICSLMLTRSLQVQASFLLIPDTYIILGIRRLPCMAAKKQICWIGVYQKTSQKLSLPTSGCSDKERLYHRTRSMMMLMVNPSLPLGSSQCIEPGVGRGGVVWSPVLSHRSSCAWRVCPLLPMWSSCHERPADL